MADATLPANGGSTTSLWPTLAPHLGVANYELLTTIGKGGFGEVWLARQKLTGVLCAVKVIPRGRVGAIELEGIRLNKQRCRGQPHVVAIEHVGETADALYYVMELADDARGPGMHDPIGYQPMTLKEHLARTGRLSLPDAVGIALEILDGLAILHAAGLLHRDIKPANIMRQSGRWKIGDMGLVTEQSRPQGRGHTPDYAPPGGVLDRAGDLYCVGRVLCELLCGRLAACEAVGGGDPVATDDAGWRLPGCLKRIIDRACNIDQDKRYQNSAEMSGSLQAVLAAPTRRRMLLVAIGAAVIGAAVSSGWVAKRHFSSQGHSIGAVSRCEMTVYFKRTSDDPEEHELRPGDVPLKTGWLVRTNVQLASPAHAYLYMVFSGEPAKRWYPASADTPALRVTSFAFPPYAEDPLKQDYLELQPPVGAAGFLLLLADAPVTSLDQLDKAMEGARLDGGSSSATLWVGDPEQPEALRQTDRGVAPELVRAARHAARVRGLEALPPFRQKQVLAFSYVQAATTKGGLP